MIAGIVLAAGRARRFGSGKLLSDVAGKPLICWGLEPCVASRLAAIRVVVDAGNAALLRALDAYFANEEKIRVVHNNDPDRGLMSSLKLGLGALGSDYQGAMVLLADMPLVAATIIDRLIAVFEEKPAIVIPTCDGELRHPKIFPRDLFGEIMDLEDDASGMAVVDRFRDRLREVAVGEPANYMDIDTPADLEILRKWRHDRP